MSAPCDRAALSDPETACRLPCGGGIAVMLFPLREHEVLVRFSQARNHRCPVAVGISRDGGLTVGPYREIGFTRDGFSIGFEPPLKFVTFGAGPEATIFAALVEGLGHDQVLISHDNATLECTRASGSECRELGHLTDIDDIVIDARLFYHDHDYEPAILNRLLSSDAFYIGAQGSRAAQKGRLQRVLDMGVTGEQLQPIRGPIGLIPSSRDPKALAVSVLSEILLIAAPLKQKGKPLEGVQR